MDKRRTLRVVKTPDTSFNYDQDETLLVETPKPKIIRKKKIEKIESEESCEEKDVTSEKEFKIVQYILKIYDLILANKIYSLIILSFIFILFTNLRIKNYEPRENFSFEELKQELQVEMEKLKEEMKEEIKEEIKNEGKGENKEIISEDKAKKVIENLATIENGALINYNETSKAYEWGLLKKSKGRDPTTILCNNWNEGECFSFKGQNGSISIAFPCISRINEIGVYHPFTRNRSSAIFEFEVFGVKNNERFKIGDFMYFLDENIFKRFQIKEVELNELIFIIKSNHGNKKYTCVYKLFAFGHI